MKKYLRIAGLALLFALLAGVICCASAEGAVKKVVIPKKLTIEAGQTYQLEPRVKPETAQTTFAYTSKKPSVAEVDENGLITAKAVGKATVTVTAANKKKASCTVTVTPVSMTSFEIEAAVWDGYTYRLDSEDTPAYYDWDATSHVISYSLVDVEPANADRTVVWSTSNKKVATVSKQGVVTCKSAGKVKITAKAKYGNASRTIDLEVAANESSYTIREALGDIYDYDWYESGEIYTMGKRLYAKKGKLYADLYVYNRDYWALKKVSPQTLYVIDLEAVDWDPYKWDEYETSVLGPYPSKLNKTVKRNSVGTMTVTIGSIDPATDYLMGYQFYTYGDFYYKSVGKRMVVKPHPAAGKAAERLNARQRMKLGR